MRKMLTTTAVAKLKPEKKRREVADAGSRGLLLVIQPSGAKSWAMRFRRPDNTHAKLTLGSVDAIGEEFEHEPVIGGHLTLSAARRLAAEVNRQRAMGKDVVEDVKATRRAAVAAIALAAQSTFPAAAHDYITHGRKKAKRNRGWRRTAQVLGLAYRGPEGEPEIISRSIADRWRDRPIASIVATDIRLAMGEARGRGIPGRATRVDQHSDSRGREMFAALSAMLGWLASEGKIDSNPAISVKRPEAPASRERALSDEEIKEVWLACDQLGYPYGEVYKMLLLTGARREEVAGMRWDELSEDHSEWTIPGRRTKNGRELLLPLPPMARDIVRNVPRSEDAVFTISGRQVSGFSKAKAKLDALLGDKVRPWRVHDLRRTSVTGMNRLGVLPHVVEAVVNHASGFRAGVAGVYNKHTYIDEKRAALERWAAHVDGLVTGRRADVVPMRSQVK